MEDKVQGIGLEAVKVAVTQLGQSEVPVGSNRGPMVDKYLAAVGLNPGYAWCQAFVYWCFGQAAKAMGVNNPVLHTAGVHDCWAHTDGKKRLLKADLLAGNAVVLPGDQLVLFYSGTSGHTCIVESVEGLIIHTIEGNSNNDGSREGYEVVRHQRRLSDAAFVGVIRYTPNP